MNLSSEQAAPYVLGSSNASLTAAPLRKTKLFNNKEIALQLDFPQKTLSKEKILNLINFTHFKREKILVHLKMSAEETDFITEAFPTPALSEIITCQWSMVQPDIDIERTSVRHLLLKKDNTIIAVPTIQKRISRESFTVKIPDESIPLEQRGLNRYACAALDAGIQQGHMAVCGKLLDFNAEAFRIAVAPEDYIFLSNLRLDREIQLTIGGGSDPLYSEQCRLSRISPALEECGLICRRIEEDVQTADTKAAIRSPRIKLNPFPVFSFTHPFVCEQYEREIINISNTGVFLAEPLDLIGLIPGMVINEFAIRFSGIPEVKGKAKVVRQEKGADCFYFGLTFVDMDIENYSRLHQILSMQNDPYAYVLTQENMDRLWEFFFDTGFIYPDKYGHLEANRDAFTKIYNIIYRENPGIERHFIYKQFGKILGHMAMIRAYPKTWLIHHHAGRSMQGKIPGFEVLKQITLYMYGMYKLPSTKINHLMCYFRPDNEYPERVFGGFSRSMQDAKVCSLDEFAYFTFHADDGMREFPEDWELKEASELDFQSVFDFYEKKSGGMFLDATEFSMSDSEKEVFKNIYSRIQFQRTWQVYSLLHEAELKACLIVNRSDIGLNLSELLNGITVILLDSHVPAEVLLTSIRSIASLIYLKSLSVLIYPLESADVTNIHYEKIYRLWVLKTDYVNLFIEYLRKNFRMRFGADVIAN